MNSPTGKLRLWWRRWRWRLLAAYLLILAAAHVWHWWKPADQPPPQCCAAMVKAIDNERTLDRKIRFAYEDRGQSVDGSLPIVLLHGSPGAADNFQRLAPMSLTTLMSRAFAMPYSSS